MTPALSGLAALMREGLNAPDCAALALRCSVGIFCTISGANKLFHPMRHAAYSRTMESLGIPCIWFMRWWVAGWLFIAGAMLTLGLFSAFAAGVLLVIMLVAWGCEAHDRVQAFHPINRADRVADYLYLPQTLYIAMLCVVLLQGSGRYSLDRLLGV